jgi:hypothetical protein
MGCRTQPATSVINTTLQYEARHLQVYRRPGPSVEQIVSLAHHHLFANTYNLVRINDGLQPMSHNYLSHIMQLIAKRRLDGCIGLVVCKGL